MLTIKNRLISMLGLYFRFPVMKRCYDMHKEIKYLDVGCGNHSPTITKSEFPSLSYYGIDLVEDYNNTPEDIANIDHFFKRDLTDVEFDGIPNGFFDVINMSHVIEHLQNGDEVIRGLLPKLKEGGIIYIEFPNMNSTVLPSKKGTLNFFDDSTHVRIYSLRELYNLLLCEGMTFVEGGRRKNLLKTLILPLLVIHNFYSYGHVEGGVLWDFMGFADYCVFKRRMES